MYSTSTVRSQAHGGGVIDMCHADEWGVAVISAVGVIVAALIGALCVKRTGACVQGPLSVSINRPSAGPAGADRRGA